MASGVGGGGGGGRWVGDSAPPTRLHLHPPPVVDQSESFWLLPGDQLIGIFKCRQFIVRADRWGWNNTVSGDNVPERDDLGSSLGFTDSGAFLPPLRQSGPLLRRPPPTLHPGKRQSDLLRRFCSTAPSTFHPFILPSFLPPPPPPPPPPEAPVAVFRSSVDVSHLLS